MEKKARNISEAIRNEKPKRTEDDIVTQGPITVILGGEEYPIPPLVIRDSREWRKKVIKLIVPLPGMVKTTMADPEAFEDSLNQILVSMPDQMLDLFFEYAKDLNKEEIEGKATDNELARAFEEVLKVAFPLAESLPGILKRLSQ